MPHGRTPPTNAPVTLFTEKRYYGCFSRETIQHSLTLKTPLGRRLSPVLSYPFCWTVETHYHFCWEKFHPASLKTKIAHPRVPSIYLQRSPAAAMRLFRHRRYYP